ncbi:MAG TPA: potassium channel family protein [Verrucomicrobiae bacterium]|nr:potassium channel family protein [Verrucomicrobiae bacterium]
MGQENVGRYAYRLLVLTTLFVLGLGTVVYHFVEHFKWVDAYYFSVITLATVGYGDLVPHTTFGKLFTTFYIFIGVGIVTTFISVTLRRRAEIRTRKREHGKAR